MTTSFASALTAAHDAAASQHYPQGALYVVATPIGNLADISLRSLHVLQIVDCIACEDTRHTQGLLRSYGLDRPGNQLLAVHQHNEAEAAQLVIERLQQGQRIAYVSDAGTPGVSDPGARLCAALQAVGLRSIPLPGASSVTSAISVAGAVTPAQGEGGFVFAGFLPTKNAERLAAVQKLADQPRCTVLLEAPHRIIELAQALAMLGERRVTLAREITKQFEDIASMPASELAAWLQASPQRVKGEFAIVLHPVTVQQESGEAERVLKLLLAELPTKTAVKLAAEITGASRNTLYDRALELKRAAEEE
ncbi:ribosomal RNA small subunit methyltransferase I [Comamonas testosteroni]|uniref:Ribosomal RNA small subunit methyltransferase I n=1 Tax=Comamonas testosteroni TaxID=285 RepID=A0A1Y1J059_COMTE|nr:MULTISPECIES: 16S rRNA (cytidine(1402)-2'-O)-methyltransferase [Comamonas]BDR11638.1 16S rRNA (cytidine(1402)-2'-O)-methyltransferase [Comamonas thiooxydans]GEQ73707.1 ribosomal RNA small subunit methyltransferase I [Comamonas testosteroni]